MFFRKPRLMRDTPPSFAKSRRLRKLGGRRTTIGIDALEERRMLSVILWTDRGDNNGADSDGFVAAYGAANAALARAIVDRAIDDWERVIENFNYLAFGGAGQPVADNTYTLSIVAADQGGGGRGVTQNVMADAQGKPYDADIQMDDDGGGAQWYFDSAPADDSEFTSLLSSFTADGPNALGGNDFYRTIVHEMGHAMGIASTAALAIHNFETAYGVDPNDGVSQLFLFQGATVSASLTANGGRHVYEGPAVGGNPTHPNDLLNAGRTVGFPPPTRQVITDLDALILRDAYGYKIELPSQTNTFHANFNSVTGALIVNGSPGAVDDEIIIDMNGSLRVQVNGTEETFEGASVTSITVLAGDGNDFVHIAGNVGIPTTVNGEDGNDTLIGGDIVLIGGAGDDYLYGSAGNDTLSGNAGNDTIYGLDGHDVIDGGTDNDFIYAGSGNNTVASAAADGNDFIDLSENSTALAFTSFGNDTVIGTALNDTITAGDGGAVRFEGRGGNDILTGGAGIDVLIAGDGSDILDGNGGADQMLGGADTDLFIWDPGDGSDVLEGETGGSDTLQFNGSGAVDTFELSANPVNNTRLRFEFAGGTVRLDVADVENVLVNALGGADTFSVNDLASTDVAVVDLNLGAADAAADTVNVNGRDADDNITVGRVGSGALTVLGLAYDIRIASAQVANDVLNVLGQDGNDVIKAVPGAETDIAIVLEGNQGNDFLSADATLRGGNDNDYLEGGFGNDTLDGGGGDDILDGRGGTNTLDGGSGTDTILVSGTAASETITTTHLAAAFTIVGGLSAGTNTITAMEQVRVEAGDGSDLIELNLDAAGGLNYEVLGGNPIGSPGDVLRVNSAALKVVTEGPEKDSGSVDVFTTVATKVSFDEIEELQLGGGGPGLLLGTNGDDDITIISRDDSTHAGADGIQDFTTSLNEGLNVLWLNTPVFLVDALAGDDDIVVREPAPNNAVWNVQLFIAGGTPAAVTGDQGDVVQLETPGTQTVIYTPNPAAIAPTVVGPVTITPTAGGIDTAILDDTTNSSPITIAPFALSILAVTVFTSSPGGAEQVVYQGLDGGDTLGINGTADDDTFVVNPTNAGAGSHRSNLAPTFDYTGATNTIVTGGPGGYDVLQVLGTEGVDTVTSTATVVSFAGAGTTTIGPGINRFELSTLGSNDDIDLDLNVTDLEKFVFAGAGNDTVNLLGTIDATIYGGDGDDTITGSPDPDLIFGESGNDILIGAGGSDVIYGGDGNDQFGDPAVRDPAANDPGNDTFFGGSGSDTFFWDPGDGDDIVEGGAGDSDAHFFSGNAGAEQFFLFADVNSPSRMHFFRVQASIDIDAADLEEFNLTSLGGTDTITIGRSDSGVLSDLSTTTLRSVDISLGNDGASDSVVVEGRPLDDNLLTSVSLGIVKVAGLSYDVRIDGSVATPAANPDRLTINGNEGNDTIKVNPTVESTIDITLNGNDGNDFLSADAIINGGAGDDFLEGGAGDDTINGNEGHDTMIGLGGADTFDGGAGFDTILVLGTPDNDTIVINQTAATTLVHTVNGDTQTDTLVTVAGVRTVEAVRVEAGAGDDLMSATWADALGTSAVLDSLRIDIVGGDNFVRDRLGILDNGTGDLVLYRKGELDSTGTVTVGPANAEPLELTFQQTELIQPVAAAGGQVEVFKHDPFEFNDFQVISTHLGADLTINLDPTIDPGADPILGLPADQDFYRVEALASGTLDFQVFFNQIATVPSGRPGLPGNGDLSIEVRDAAGNIIVGFGVNDATSNERVRIPAVQGQLYFLRVVGATGAAINNYTATIINTPAQAPYDIELDDNLGFGDVVAGTAVSFSSTSRPGPQFSGLSAIDDYYVGKEITFTSGALDGETAVVTDYVAATGTFTVTPAFSAAPAAGDDFQVDAVDTGRSQLDNITRDNTPTIFFRLDDGFFLNDLPGNPAPDTPPDEVIVIPFQPGFAQPILPGYAIAIFDEGDGTVGSTPPQIPLGFATAVPGEPGVYVFTTPLLTDGSHFLSARVQMIDPANPQQTGFGARSVSLEIIVDTVEPEVSFGDPVAVDDGLLPDSDSGVSPPNPDTLIDRITNDVTPGFWGRAEADAIVRMYVDINNNGTFEQNLDLFIGQNTAIPLDGTNQEPHGYWEINSVINFNDPTFFPLDGLRTVFVVAEDVAGNINLPGNLEVQQTLQIFIDTQGPQITSVEIDGYEDYDLFNPKGPEANIQGPTPLITRLEINFQDLPLRVIPFLYRALKDETVVTDHFQLIGDQNGRIAIQNIELVNVAPAAPGLATAQVTLVFFGPLPDDRFTLIVTDDVMDIAGNRLDGETNAAEPVDDPRFPTGDGVPGGDFVARFTVDSHPELAVYAGIRVYVDLNGNFQFDPEGQDNDAVNRDIVFRFGSTSDSLFAGKFVSPGTPLVPTPPNPGDPLVGGVQDRYFDQIAAYGNILGVFRWVFDFDSDGVADYITSQPAGFQINGTPVAGNFDNNIANGDEVGLFDGTRWWRDTNHDFVINGADAPPITSMSSGFAQVGDIDGDAKEDFVTFSGVNNTYFVDFAADGLGAGFLASIPLTLDGGGLGFPGVNERPTVADMNQDGIDDLGVWVPGNLGQTPTEISEWYFLVSQVLVRTGTIIPQPLATHIPGTPVPLPAVPVEPGGLVPAYNTLWAFPSHTSVSGVPHFQPVPFGTSLFADFGDEPAFPIVGNFDPPGDAAFVDNTTGNLASNNVVVTSAGSGIEPRVHVYDRTTGELEMDILAYHPNFRGGVRVATADVNGDGAVDIITAPGVGGGPHIRVFDGVTGNVLREFMAYDAAFAGGVQIAAGDIDGDGKAEIVTGPGAGGGPHVRIFSGASNAVLGEYFAYSSAFGGGVNVAVGDVNGDGTADVVTGPGAGGGPHVRVFSGKSANELMGFMAYNPLFGGGVFVAAGDVDGDGHDEVITGAGAGGGPHVRIFSGDDGHELGGFFAYDAAFGGGVRVAAGDLDGDGRADILTGAGIGGGPHARAFDGDTLEQVATFMAFDAGFSGGVFVAAPNLGGGQALRAASQGSGGAALSQSQLDQFVAAAFGSLGSVRARVADLPGSTLGLAYSDLVLIDADAAGHGWFVDSTPGTSDDLDPSSIDLLSALSHELGHVLGLDHDDDGLMAEELSAGVRPSLEAIDALFARL